MKHFVIAIDWYGPFPLKKAVSEAKEHLNGGLYLCIGRQKWGRSRLPQYIGISSHSVGTRLETSIKPQSVIDAKFWIGEVITSEATGPRTKATPRTLDEAEWLHAYFMELGLNEKKRIKPPSRPVTVLNRWWKPDGEYDNPWVMRPHPDWPDLIDFRGPKYSARIVWFGGKLKRVPPPFFSVCD
jgi:hypothetical protein